MHEDVYRVLFVGRENAARSLMAEALLRDLAGDRFEAFSAGVDPADGVDPLALRTLDLAQIPADGLRVKQIGEFLNGGGMNLDFVIVVSDRVGADDLPPFPGNPMVVNWGTDDPRAADGTEPERQVVYGRALRQLRNRIEVFANLSIERLDRLVLQAKLDTLGDVRPRD